jgi:3-phenylpropionate/trans-cinnamate dioxygenase ferredoxin reductase subunit
MKERVLVVGAGHAGARCAIAVREQGWQGEVVLVGEELDCPYERPPLSKAVLEHGADPADATILSLARASELGIRMLRGEIVIGIDPGRHEVRLSSAHLGFHYTHLVLATGSRPRKLPVPGTDLAGVHTLRTAADARILAPALQPGTSVVLIGGGFIGLEVAASARQRGCRVTVLETAPQLLARVLNPAIAGSMAALHRARGVDVRLGVRILALEGLQTVRRVRLADGATIDADLVIVGVGALANDGLPTSAGMDCADGVMVDNRARTTAPRVLAIGDLARHQSLWGARNVRLESWENAELQARTAARSIVGLEPEARGVPWFWTDQFDVNLQILGFPRVSDDIVMRGRFDSPSWCAFMMDEGRITGACLANAGRERRVITQLMSGRQAVGRAELADTQRPLKSLLAAMPAAAAQSAPAAPAAGR